MHLYPGAACCREFLVGFAGGTWAWHPPANLNPFWVWRPQIWENVCADPRSPASDATGEGTMVHGTRRLRSRIKMNIHLVLPLRPVSVHFPYSIFPTPTSTEHKPEQSIPPRRLKRLICRDWCIYVKQFCFVPLFPGGLAGVEPPAGARHGNHKLAMK